MILSLSNNLKLKSYRFPSTNQILALFPFNELLIRIYQLGKLGLQQFY